MKAKILAIFLIYTGAMLFVYGIYLVRERYIPVDFKRNVVSAQSPNNLNFPAKISIPSLQLVLPITPATIQKSKWDNPEHSVGYWKESSIPGAKGNSVFYGHNWPTIFGNLKNIKLGDEIKIEFDNGTYKTFIVKSKNVVTSDQTHILDQTNDTRITLYTCTGFLDFKRLVVVATPTN